jgi:hypothetical protein
MRLTNGIAAFVVTEQHTLRQRIQAGAISWATREHICDLAANLIKQPTHRSDELAQ